MRVESLVVLILSVLPAASYVYAGLACGGVLLPSLHSITVSFFHTTPTTFQHIASPNPLTGFQLLLVRFLSPPKTSPL